MLSTFIFITAPENIFIEEKQIQKDGNENGYNNIGIGVKKTEELFLPNQQQDGKVLLISKEIKSDLLNLIFANVRFAATGWGVGANKNDCKCGWGRSV